MHLGGLIRELQRLSVALTANRRMTVSRQFPVRARWIPVSVWVPTFPLRTRVKRISPFVWVKHVPFSSRTMAPDPRRRGTRRRSKFLVRWTFSARQAPLFVLPASPGLALRRVPSSASRDAFRELSADLPSAPQALQTRHPALTGPSLEGPKGAGRCAHLDRRGWAPGL